MWLSSIIAIKSNNVIEHLSGRYLSGFSLYFNLPSRLGLQNTPTAALQRDKIHPTSGYVTKLSDGEVPAMLELCRMRSTPSLPSLPGPPLPGVVAPDKVLSLSQIELNCVG